MAGRKQLKKWLHARLRTRRRKNNNESTERDEDDVANNHKDVLSLAHGLKHMSTEDISNLVPPEKETSNHSNHSIDAEVVQTQLADVPEATSKEFRKYSHVNILVEDPTVFDDETVQSARLEWFPKWEGIVDVLSSCATCRLDDDGYDAEEISVDTLGFSTVGSRTLDSFSAASQTSSVEEPDEDTSALEPVLSDLTPKEAQRDYLFSEEYRKASEERQRTDPPFSEESDKTSEATPKDSIFTEESDIESKETQNDSLFSAESLKHIATITPSPPPSLCTAEESPISRENKIGSITNSPIDCIPNLGVRVFPEMNLRTRLNMTRFATYSPDCDGLGDENIWEESSVARGSNKSISFSRDDMLVKPRLANRREWSTLTPLSYYDEEKDPSSKVFVDEDTQEWDLDEISVEKKTRWKLSWR